MAITERGNVKEKILASARDLFVREGYEAVSMRKIAAAIDYTAMALYRHFADKDSLLRELCLEDFRTLRQAMDRIAFECDPIRRLHMTGLVYVDFALKFPNQYRLLFLTPLPREVHVEQVMVEHPEVDCYARLRQMVAEGILAGRYRKGLDEEMISQLVWAALHGIVSLHILMKRASAIEWKPVAETAEAMLNALLEGLVVHEKS